jgi:hypothetical protein
LGAVKLSRLVGCAISLISALERSDADSSEYNDAFAAALGVSPIWLAHGDENRAPEGWNAEAARTGRQGMGSSRDHPAQVVHHLPAPRARQFAAGPIAPIGRADELQKQMVNDVMEYTRLAGPQRAGALIETLGHIASFVSFESVEGENQVGSLGKGDDSAG